jgi:hypothetical protein
MADNPKLFVALLNGVLRRVFERDQSITPEFLKEQVFAGEDLSVEGGQRRKGVGMTNPCGNVETWHS